MISSKRRAEIDATTRGVHLEMLQGGKLRYSTGIPPISQQLSPELALEKYGFEVMTVDSMPGASGGKGFRVAGMIDFGLRIVFVQSGLSHAVRRFTLGHELGHVVLHEGLAEMRMHRERPIDRQNLPGREWYEVEADYFSVRYQAPDKTVEHFFEKLFGRNPLVLDETTAFHIAKTGAQDLLASDPSGLAFAIAVARADHYNGHHITPLTSIFQLSAHALGIRLKELNLVAY